MICVLKGQSSKRNYQMWEDQSFGSKIYRSTFYHGTKWSSSLQTSIASFLKHVHDVFHVFLLRKYRLDLSHVVESTEV